MGDYTPDDIYAAMRQADAAGDGAAVKALAAHLQTLQSAPPAQPVDEEAFRSQLHDILAAPKIDREAVHALFRNSGYSDADPSVDQGIDYAVAHPGHVPNLRVNGNLVTPPNGAVVTAAKSGADWFSAGLLNPVSAALDAVVPGVNKLDGPGIKSVWDGTSFGDAYHNNLATFRREDEADTKAHPIASAVGAGVGGVLSPVNKIAAPVKGASLIANLARVGASGATYGAVHGAATSNAGTVTGVASDAGKEAFVDAAGATVLGAGLSAASSTGSRLISAATRVARGVPEPGAGANLVAKSMAQDGLTPAQALSIVQSARSTGTPMMLADLGENLRSRAGSVSRIPGPARTIATSATLERQMGQTGRVRDAINDTVGPTTDTFAEHQQLMEQAKAAAAPLYATFHALPSRTSENLESLINTPVGRGALAQARTIAMNDRVDPNKLGFTLNDQGEVALTKNPSPQTLDYVKQGLDDALEKYRDSTTGKLRLDRMGRSIENVRKSFVAEMDKLYPGTYAAARGAYGGPAAMAEALNDGKAAISKSANEINQRLNNMSDAERQQYALGFRSAIADAIEKAPDGANVARRVIGSTAKRQALARVFGGNVDDLITRLENESATHRTYTAVHGGPATANRLAEDASTNSDLGLLEQGFDLVNAAKNGKTGLIGHLVSKGRDALTYGQGQVGQRTREDASALLFNSDPLALTNALDLSTSQRLLAAANRSVIARRGLVAGGRTGTVMGAAVSRRH
jgi:hypothetical protein